MEGKQALVAETINKINVCNNAKQKVQHLEQLEELLLRSEPALLDGFLSELVPLQMDRAASVRRKLLSFATAAVRVRPSPAVLSTAAPCVQGMLSDDQPQLAREAAQAAHTLLDKALVMLAGLPQDDPAATAAWSAVQSLQQDLSSKAVSLASSSGGSSSRQVALCLAGIKMTEQAVLRYTADATGQLALAQALTAEANQLAQTLVQLLAVADVKQRAGPVVIGAVKALGTWCQQRPQLVPTVLPPLLTLAQQVFKVPKADDQQSGIEASCGAALKDVLVRLYRSNSEPCKPWIQQLHQALQVMGADAAAESAARHLQRQAARAREPNKRKAADHPGRDPKVPRAGTPAGGDSTPGRTPTPTPMMAPPGSGSGSGSGGVDFPTDLMSLFRPAPGANLHEALNNAQQVLEVLVQAQEQQAVDAILLTIAPEVLAELVLRWMDNLPEQPAEAPQQQPAAAAAAPSGPADNAGFTTMGFAQCLQQAMQQPPAQAAAMQQQLQQPGLLQAIAAATAAPGDASSRQPQQVSDPRRKAPAAAPTPTPAPAAAAPVAPQLPSPLPVALRPEQVVSMRTGAVQRILSATRNKPVRNFRELLLSRLASRAADTDGLSDLMLQHVFANYHQDRGHLLLVRWLYAMAAVAVENQQQQQHLAAAAGTPAVGSNAGTQGSAEGAGLHADADATMQDAPSLDDNMAAGAAAAAAGNGESIGVAADADKAGEPAGQEAVAMDTAGDGQQEAAGSPGQKEGGDAPQQQEKEQEHQQQQQEQEGQQQQQHQQEQEQEQQQQQVPQHNSKQQQKEKQDSRPSSSSSSGSLPSDLSNTSYEAVLMASLRGLRDNLPGTDPAIPRLLQDAPVLPLAAVTAFLRGLVTDGGDWAAMGLNAAYSLFEGRPAARLLLLQLLLDAAVCADGATREKAVGCVVSRLMSWEQHAQAVVEFATAQLLLLLKEVEEEQPPAAVEQQQQDGQQAEQPKQQPTAEQPTNGVQKQQPSEQQHADAAAGDGDAAVSPVPARCMDVETAAQHSMLYLSLCTLKPELLRLLLETFGKAGPDARAAMCRYAPSLAVATGPTQPVLLELIRQPPEGSQDLLLVMITALADQQLPPQPLVAACAAHFKATGSVQLLDPAVISLAKDDIIKLLPKLLVQLPDQRLRLLYRRLALPVHGREPLFKPVDLLVLLHRLEFSAEDWNKHKQHIMMAVDRAMRTPEVFPAAVMQTAINRMESLNPTPRLFMRSVNIMVNNAAAPLVKWVLELLQRLITKQVWKSKTQWKGFLVCCEKLQDQGSALVLLQLPSNVLHNALEQLPRSLWKKLYDVANANGCPVPVYLETKKTVELYYEKFLKAEIEQKQADNAARQAAAAAAVAAAAAAGGASCSNAAAAGGAGAATSRLARTSTGSGTLGVGGASRQARVSTGASGRGTAPAPAAGGGGGGGSLLAPKADEADKQQNQQPPPAAAVGQALGSSADGSQATAAAAPASNAPSPPEPGVAPAADPPGPTAAAAAAAGGNDDDDDFVLDFEDSD